MIDLTLFFLQTGKVQKKYHNMGHPVSMVSIEKDRRGLGISLSGHKDRNKMAVFICGIHPNGMAFKTGGLAAGDEILEVCTKSSIPDNLYRFNPIKAYPLYRSNRKYFRSMVTYCKADVISMLRR